MIRILKFLSIIAASAAISGYVVHHNNQTTALDFQHLQLEADKLYSEIEQLQQTNAQLQQNNAQLQQLLLSNKGADNATTTVATQQSSLAPRTEPQHLATQLPTEKSAGSTALAQLQDEKLLHQSENFGKWLSDTYKEKGTFNLHEEMQQRFDAEEVDPAWAEMQEQEYFALFDKNPELAGLALREAQCRSQQCAVTVSISDVNQANTLVEKMTATLKQNNKYPMIIAAPDEQRGVTTLYIGKDADSFEFN
jgi:hypothetical protein